MMDPVSCRAELARLLAEETRLLAGLEQQLEREHGYLASNDIDSLERAGSTRQATVAELLKIEDERASLCRMLGRGEDRFGLAALFAWCDPEGSLATAQAECSRLAGSCRALNERNGALVTARLNRLAGMLEMIGPGNAARTYEPGAARNAPVPAGRIVSTSA